MTKDDDAPLSASPILLHGRPVRPGDWIFVSTRSGWRSYARVRQVGRDGQGRPFAVVAGPGERRALHVDGAELLPLPQVAPIRYGGWRFAPDA